MVVAVHEIAVRCVVDRYHFVEKTASGAEVAGDGLVETRSKILTGGYLTML